MSPPFSLFPTRARHAHNCSAGCGFQSPQLIDHITTPRSPTRDTVPRSCGPYRPNGGRIHTGTFPATEEIAIWQRDSSSETLARGIIVRPGCVSVWLPRVWPRAAISRTRPWQWRTKRPIRKKVARTAYRSSKSRMRGVTPGFGPSSKVSAISPRRRV
jgi:hypothetical protein